MFGYLFKRFARSNNIRQFQEVLAREDHFTRQRAKDLDEKERYDNSPFNWDGMPYAYDE